MEIGEFQSASELLALAVDRAHQLQETRVWADAVVTWLSMRRFIADDLERWGDDVIRELGEVIPLLEEISAHDELAKGFRLLGLVHGSSLQWSEQLDADRRALEHARLAGDARLEARLTAEYTAVLRDGPTPVREAIQECEAALERGLEDRQAHAFVYCSLARLHAMEGDFTRARDLIGRADRMRNELGANVIVPLTSLQSSRLEALAGDLQTAEQDLRRDFAKLSAMGDKFGLPLVGALLANTVLGQGRYEEAASLHAEADMLADAEDIETKTLLRSVRARLLARDEDLAEAERVARKAVAALDGIESPDLRGDCLVTLAEVVAAASRRDEAREILQDAHAQYMLKGNLVSAERALARLDELAVAEQPV